MAEQRPYTWKGSDQPGIWYALTQAHKDLSIPTPYPHQSTTGTTKTRGVSRFVIIQTGLIDTNCAFGPEMNAYLQRGWCRHGK